MRLYRNAQKRSRKRRNFPPRRYFRANVRLLPTDRLRVFKVARRSTNYSRARRYGRRFNRHDLSMSSDHRAFPCRLRRGPCQRETCLHYEPFDVGLIPPCCSSPRVHLLDACARLAHRVHSRPGGVRLRL